MSQAVGRQYTVEDVLQLTRELSNWGRWGAADLPFGDLRASTAGEQPGY